MIGQVGGRSLQAFEQSAAALPAPKPTAELIAMDKALAEGQAALETGDVADAIEAFNKVVGSRVDAPAKATAKDALAKIETEASGKLAEAIAQQDPVAAHDAIEAVAKEYRGSSTADEATKELRKLEASDAYKAVVVRQEGDARNRKWLDEAKAQLEAQKYNEAQQSLQRIVESGLEGPTLDEAKMLLEELQNDPAKMSAAREAQAQGEVERVMSMAKNYLSNGNKAKAIEKLEEVAKKYEGTDWAKKARAMVDGIKKGTIK